MAILGSLSIFPSPKLHYLSSPPTPFAFTLFNPKITAQTFNLRFKANAISTSLPCVGQDLPIEYDQFLPKPDPVDRRRAGILLHPTSFRGRFGIGDLGDEAFRFIDWLHLAGCSVWQVLPLVPPDEGGSPYSGKDANCGNTLLISLEELVKDGLLSKDELPEPINAECVNFSIVSKLKDSLITKAAWRLILSEGELRSELHDFRGDPNISRETRGVSAVVLHQKKDLVELSGVLKELQQICG